MSRRRGVQVTEEVVVGGHGVPANFRTVSAHVRVYWPPHATREQVAEALRLAVMEAGEQIVATVPEGDR